MTRDLLVRCDAAGCVRGIVHLPAGFGDPCSLCEGRGSLSLATICKRIDENEGTVRKILKPHRAMRPKVAARICAKLVSLAESPKAWGAAS